MRGLSSSSSTYSEYTYDDDADVEDNYYEDDDAVTMTMMIEQEHDADDEQQQQQQEWLPPIIIPGPFVVLQGTAGDGMANTINFSPQLPPHPSNTVAVASSTSNRVDRRRQRDRLTVNTNQQQQDDNTDASFHHVARHRPTPQLGRLATSTANNPYARGGVMNHNTTLIVPTSTIDNGSYAVVTDNDPHENDDDDHGSSSSSIASQWQEVVPTNAADMEAIAKWKIECKQTELEKQQDWKECLHQVPSRLLDHVMITATTVTTTTSNTNSTCCCCWWQHENNHQVAILRDIPTKLRNGNVLRTVIGSFPPGTTFIARDIVHLDSHTLQRLPVLPQRILLENHQDSDDNDDDDIQRLVYPRGQKGVIQLLQVETPEGRAGYAVLSLEGYSLIAPGIPQNYIDPQLWMWRVSCPAGAFVREGLDLTTQHRDTIPYGSLMRVTRRCISNQGLSRLKAYGTIPPDSSTSRNHQQVSETQQEATMTSTEERRVDGWCSELLNPLSGQRGIIAQPLPFPVPAIYRVVFPDGAVVRRDVELSSPQVGEIPCGSQVKIVARAFSEHPVDKCIERLQLAGNAGWISVRLNRMPPHDDMVVELVGVDTDFDPENPGIYHLKAQRAVQRQRQRQESNAMQMQTSQADLSSVDENDVSDDDTMDGPGRENANRTTNGSSFNIPESHCVVCLTSERNATIVHGSTGHVVCCLVCARILKARGDACPICRLKIDLVIQHFYA
ncbi:zinc finger C3HC4 type domain containing protein [Nitzschia inconspicua]|uniref:Zinc finger C3HC4 type domain containing protein n=1 Tax=Nitzschia inconspicua TaxID=303405 RepID=A0A9K3M1W5_9STRA|nr:zinc finger C3HC4 type domain containing protein [Nitzschia inconspicua]